MMLQRCIVAAAVLALPTIGGAELFHNGSVGSCDGCHTRSRAEGSATSGFQNSTTATGAAQAGYMLNGSDPGSTCLNCHGVPNGMHRASGHFVATGDEDLQGNIPPTQLTPGGDFGWLKKSYRWSREGGASAFQGETSPGERHGHNIVAVDYGYSADTSNPIAPGGTYPAEGFSCISCHDPHGNYRRGADGAIRSAGFPIKSSGSYADSPDPDTEHTVGSYRLLAGRGYQPKSLQGDYVFTADPPAAVSPALFNRAETLTDTRVAYGKSMSEWCQNCHTSSHKNGGHPAGNTARFSTETVRIYNTYVASGNSTGKVPESYSSLVPYEMGTDEYATLKRTANSDGSDRNGPRERPNVFCLSCHRAHASGWDHMTRWNMKSGMILSEGKFPGVDNDSPPMLSQGRTSLETQRALYDRPSRSFSSYQRGLCSKCHAKD